MLPVERLPSNEASAFAFVYTLVIFALIYNTAFSLFYSTARRFSGGSTACLRIVLVGVVVAGYVASFMGFKKLIGVMYPIIGWLRRPWIGAGSLL